MADTLRKSIRNARHEIAAYLNGDVSGVKIQSLRVPDDVDVKAVRESLALTQKQFADMFGFKLATVQSWERTLNRRMPNRTARVLITALRNKPEAILGALVEAQTAE